MSSSHQSQSQTQTPSQTNYRYYVTIDDAIERIGYGVFQYKLLVACGLCFMSDAIEVLLLSFLATCLQHEWNLTPWELQTLIAAVFGGALLGTLVLGVAGDMYGRRTIFLVTSIIITFFGFLTVVVVSYAQLVVVRFMVGFGIGGLTIPFDTLCEFLPVQHRGTKLLSIEFFWTFGTILVPILAYWTLGISSSQQQDGNDDDGGIHAFLMNSPWRLFVFVCSLPCLMSTLLGLVLVPESPRWLLLQQQHDMINTNDDDTNSHPHHTKALEILKYVALQNGVSQQTIDTELFPPETQLIVSWREVGSAILVQHQQQQQQQHLGEDKEDEEEKDQQQQQQQQQCSMDCCYYLDEDPATHNNNNYGSNNNFMKLLSPSNRRSTLLLYGTWFGLGFLYYGIVLTISSVFTTTYGEEADDGTANNSDTYYEFDYAGICITALAEVVGLCLVLYTIDKFGRIPTQTISYRLGGCATLVLGLLVYYYYNLEIIENDNNNNNYNNSNNDNAGSDSYRYCVIGIAFVARMFIMAATCVTWVTTSELFPTNLRTTGHGTANAMARLGGFLVPYILGVGAFNSNTNSLSWLFGIIILFLVSFVTAEFASRLPETAGKSLHDTATATSNVTDIKNNDTGDAGGVMMTKIMDTTTIDDDDDNKSGIPLEGIDDTLSTSSSTQPIPVPPSAVQSTRRSLSRTSAVTTTTNNHTEKDRIDNEDGSTTKYHRIV